jgi:hypothetical protein
MIPVFAKGDYKGRSPRETCKVFEGTPSPSLSYLAKKSIFFHQLFCLISGYNKDYVIKMKMVKEREK